MAFNPFRFLFPKKILGIDIGTSSIKVVEVSRWGGGKTLENYGEIKATALFKESFRVFEKTTHLVSSFFVSRAIKAILEEARIKTRAAIFSVPDFSTFFTSFELPPMRKEEIPEAVRFAAPQYTPLPISETTLDWRIIERSPNDKKSNLKILLAAIPNDVVREYQKIAQMAGLELYAIEAEVLGLVRASIKENKKVICLVDIGVQSTTCSIIDKGVLKKSYSFDFSSAQLTHTVATALDVGQVEAEELKSKYGIIPSENKDLSKILFVLIDPLLIEITKIAAEFSQNEGRTVEEVYLAGGTANLPGLKEYISENLKIKAEIPNPFSDFLFPPILADTLKEMAPRFTVAVGTALGGLEK